MRDLDGTPSLNGSAPTLFSPRQSLALSQLPGRRRAAVAFAVSRLAASSATTDGQRDLRRSARGRPCRRSGLPHRPSRIADIAEAIEWASRVRAATSAVLRDQGHGVSLVADEGGLAAPLPSNRAALEIMLAGIERSGLEPGAEVAIAVDIAATQLVSGQGYASLARAEACAGTNWGRDSGVGRRLPTSRSRTRLPRTIRTVGYACQTGSRAVCSWSAMTFSSPL